MDTPSRPSLTAVNRVHTLTTVLALLTDAELRDLLALVQTELATRVRDATAVEAPHVREGTAG